MNINSVRTMLVIAVLVSIKVFAQDSPIQSEASFNTAIKTRSTSPRYVQITVVDGNTGHSETICTVAPLLIGAIHREYGLSYNAADSSKAYEIALNTSKRIFTFSRAEALANIPRRYTNADTDNARAEVELFVSQSPDHRLQPNGIPSEWRGEALACALIERGYSPGESDIGGQIYLAP